MQFAFGTQANVVEDKLVDEAVGIGIEMTGVFTIVAGMVLTQRVEANYVIVTLV